MRGRRGRLRDELVAEYLAGQESFREMEERCGVAASTLHRWVKQHEREAASPKKHAVERVAKSLVLKRRQEEQERPTDEVIKLRRELAEERLHNKLLNAMIDIAEEQIGVVIRKKHGAKR